MRKVESKVENNCYEGTGTRGRTSQSQAIYSYKLLLSLLSVFLILSPFLSPSSSFYRREDLCISIDSSLFPSVHNGNVMEGEKVQMSSVRRLLLGSIIFYRGSIFSLYFPFHENAYTPHLELKST